MSSFLFRIMNRLAGYEFSNQAQSLATVTARLESVRDAGETAHRSAQREILASQEETSKVLEELGARLGGAERDVDTRIASVERGFDARLGSIERDLGAISALEARLTFVERCLGASLEAPAVADPQALETLLDQRLAMVESRLLAVLEGPYLERVTSLSKGTNVS